MLSYGRETALQGALFLAKSGKLDLRDNNFTNIIGLSLTTVTLSAAKLSISVKNVK